MTTRMKKAAPSMGKPSMTEGMSNKSYRRRLDESMRPPKGSVNSDTTRDGTAKSPRTLGPREA